MKKRSDRPAENDRLRLIGLGERSLHKSYFPELKKRLEELERFRALLDNSSDMLFLVDAASGRIEDANETACARLGRTRAELLRMTMGDISEGAGGGFCLQPRADREAPFETAFHTSSMELIPVEMTFNFTREAEGADDTTAEGQDELRHCVIVARDVTRRKAMEDALRLTQHTMDSSNTPIFWLRQDGSLTYVNEAACRHLGYTRAELLALNLDEIDPDRPVHHWGEGEWNRMRAMGRRTFEARHRRKDGSIVPVEVQSDPVSFAGEEYHCAFVTDITERKQAEQRLQDSLREKETLLKEVHHRVKNNLQIVVSLLNLQMRDLTDQTILEPLRESASRVAAMALVHEQIYRSDTLSRVALDDYLGRLATQILKTFKSATVVSLEVRIPSVDVSLDKAIPLGLLVNEVLTNSLKHGFVGRDTGAITIRLAVRGGIIRLTMSDDGVGLPRGIRPDRLSSLGLQLVFSLARQLDGSIALKRSGGTTFSLTFPAEVDASF
ncbi:signal transduction histidine kinase [Desulfovibrio sp. X2]|uniref:sensor histidine kinase n=1 Tax=Desulfovibrio sp. X2 TaxID=941449 RepID=UPI000358F0F1|nr:PAS domain S-box protein [Desulfovibrio sp. X2]EPR37540.1 signal transduction histidine kinase [Desulfovibrio sp. X2]